ncbi:MAG: hypothetical protein ACPH9T_04940, partial [Paracoccaceae bacterium]
HTQIRPILKGSGCFATCLTRAIFSARQLGFVSTVLPVQICSALCIAFLSSGDLRKIPPIYVPSPIGLGDYVVTREGLIDLHCGHHVYAMTLLTVQ